VPRNGSPRKTALVEPVKLDREPLVWPPTECPPWCWGAANPTEQHMCDVGVEHPADRRHGHTCDSSTNCGTRLGCDEIQLTLEKPFSYRTSTTSGGNAHQYLSVELSQHYREVEPEIQVTHHHAAPGARSLSLTVAEARELRDLLGHLVDLAEGGAQ
jgi:hypothetical protein